LEGSLAGVSRAPFFKYSMKVCISELGTIQLELKGDVRKDAVWLPRLGFEFELPKTSNEFQYYGRGPIESYCDMYHGAPVGLYESTTDAEYVNYVYPQEHGNHNQVKMLRIGKLQFIAQSEFEINVSKYNTQTLSDARHTDELTEDGKTHLRIDYKVSGLGSNSCGPELAEKYRLKEKEISFGFAIKPWGV